MPWVLGIDEAGYGPNLGPLVQACVGFYLPDDDLTGWRTFRDLFRRANEPNDGRLIADDSKKVYSGGHGFEELERTVTPLTLLFVQSITDLLQTHLPTDGEQTLLSEYWFDSLMQFPLMTSHGEAEKMFNKVMSIPSVQQVGWMVLVYPTATKRFNELVDHHGTKAGILSDRMITFFRVGVNYRVPFEGDQTWQEPIHFFCDKLGGRHYYGSFLQEAFPEGWPVAEIESPNESRYRIKNLHREVTVTFTPRADAASVPVALASMVAKYIREVCMKQFNAYWQSHVPGLAPTAGYPVDAKRYYAAITPMMSKLGLVKDQVWRKK